MQSFDFNNISQYGQQFVYPNQTSINGGRNDGLFVDGILSNFMTPSPDSPGQWSSGINVRKRFFICADAAPK